MRICKFLQMSSMRRRQSLRVTHACVDYMCICASTSHANAPASLPSCLATRTSFSSTCHMNLIDPLHLFRPNIKSVPSPSTWTTGLDPIHIKSNSGEQVIQPIWPKVCKPNPVKSKRPIRLKSTKTGLNPV